MPSAVLSPSSSFLSFSDVEDLSEKLNRELKIAGGAESILEQLRNSSTNSGNEALRVQVEKQWIEMNADKFIKMTCGGSEFQMTPTDISSKTTNYSVTSKRASFTGSETISLDGNHITASCARWDYV